MKSNTNRRKLRNFFISKDVQRPMVVAQLVYILLVAAVLIATVLSPFYTDIFKTGDLMDKHHTAKLFIVLLERLSIATLFIVGISFFYFILLTHKLCGPLVNIGRTIERISDRDFTRKIHLRKGDFLKKEAKQINSMMMTLSNSIADIKRENLLLIEDIEKSIQACGQQTESDAKLKDFQDRANRCLVQLDDFQLIGDNTNNVDSGQHQQLVSVDPYSANNGICPKIE
jgi:nitrate/nitrite-specific signal transduction histidine kinase